MAIMKSDLEELERMAPKRGAEILAGVRDVAKLFGHTVGTIALRFDVLGEPAPQGSKKFVGIAKSSGRGILVESSKKVKPWRNDIRDAARAAHGEKPPIDGALRVRMVFTVRKPASAPKRKRTWANKKPDLSKLARSTEDALVDAGVIADDARIVEYTRLAKVFPGEDGDALTHCTGARIEIEVIDDAEVCAV